MSNNYATVPSISDVWGENTAPLNQTREETREDIRQLLGLSVTLGSLGDLTTNMNTTAELSVPAVSGIEADLAEYKTLEAKKITVQSESAWEGAAPLKKADVVEYDTSLLTSGASVSAQTQGIDARMAEIVRNIKVGLGYASAATGQGLLYRS